MTTRYLDLEGGNDANDGSTFALRKKTIASAAAGLNINDTVRVMASESPVNTGINATWTNQSDTVTLASALTANIDDCENAWTASANVTATASTSTFLEGTKSANLVVASGFTTGLIAYRAVGTLDFSAYEQISLLFRCTTNLSAGALELRLCSDAAGVTAVDTFSFPAITSGAWVTLVYNKAAALGASIQSVALYAISDPGSNTLNLDNIIACKAAGAADCLTHKKMIGKGLADTDEPFFAIDSINGTTIKIGRSRMLTASGARTTYAGLYGGTTSTQTLYTRAPVEAAGQTLSVVTNLSGGWNRTDMSTQDGLTYWRNPAPGSSTLSCTSVGASISRICPVQCGIDTTSGAGIVLTGNFATLRDLWCIACGNAILSSGSLGHDIDIYGVAMVRRAFYTSGSVGANPNYPTRITMDKAWGDGAIGITQTLAALVHLSHSYPGQSFILDVAEVRNFGTASFYQSAGTAVVSNLACKNMLNWQNNCDVGIDTSGTEGWPPMQMYNCSLADGSGLYDALVYSKKHGGVDGDDRLIDYTTGDNVNTILKATDQRHTASGVSWKYLPAVAAFTVPTDPMVLPLGVIPCPAGELRTVKLWVRRTNTAAQVRLVARGGFNGGVPADVIVDASGAANTWQQETISFTPTEAGVVPIEVHFGEGHTAWIDDLEVT